MVVVVGGDAARVEQLRLVRAGHEPVDPAFLVKEKVPAVARPVGSLEMGRARVDDPAEAGVHLHELEPAGRGALFAVNALGRRHVDAEVAEHRGLGDVISCEHTKMPA